MMLPSRSVLRSSGAQRQLIAKFASNGRGFGTLRPISHGSGSNPLATLRAKTAAPIALGSAASARHLSLWGYGSKKSEPAPSTTQIESSAAKSGDAFASEANVQSVPLDAAPASSTTSPPVDLSAINDIVNESTSSAGHDILTRSQDYIGYLHDLGLNYGYGFTASMQWVVEHIHVWGGQPWAISIMAAAVALRVAMFYPMIKSTTHAARVRRMQEDPRQKQLKQLMKNGALADQNKIQQLRAINVILQKEYQAPTKNVLWSFIPIPFSFGLFRAVTGMTSLPVPGWETAGYLWFQDLTASDPYFVLPFATAVIMALTMRVNRRNTAIDQRATMDKITWAIFPLIIFATSWLSAAVNLMGVAFGGATLVSSALLNNNGVRRLFGIPIAREDPLTASTPVVKYAAPRNPNAPVTVEKTGGQSIRAGIDSLVKSVKEKVNDSVPNQEAQAEKARRKRLQQAEDQAAAQREQDFINKYKK